MPKGTEEVSAYECLKLREDENAFSVPAAGDIPFEAPRGPDGAPGTPTG